MPARQNDHVQFIQRHIVVFAWVVFLLSLYGIFQAFNLALLAFYHPMKGISAYAGYFNKASLAVAFVAFVVALRITIFRNRVARSRLVSEFGVFLLAVAAIFFGAFYFVAPLPDEYVRYIGDDRYVVPRIFRPTGGSQPNERREFSITYCAEDMRGIYQDYNKCDNRVLYIYDDRLKDVYRSVITGIQSYVVEIQSGLIVNAEHSELDEISDRERVGYTNYDRHRGYGRSVHFLTDEQGNVTLMSSCISPSFCNVLMESQIGVLRFRHSAGPEFDPEIWESNAAKFTLMMSQWRR